VVSAAPAESTVLDSLAVISWNTHVGGGAVDRLITDLRSGALTDGSPVPHFVLALQEVFREGDAVPSSPPDDARCAGAICERTPQGARRTVEEIARLHELELFYVPSMRNGELVDGRPEDRGNAILSTLSLSERTAVELPLAKQRRVAVAAAVAGETAAGSPWELELINLHLDGFSPLRHFFGSFGRCRTRQLDFLTAALDGDHPAILAGDLNTWFRGSNESVVDQAQRTFPIPEQIPEGATYRAGVIRRQLDYVFFRLPDEWNADYRRLDDTYGSDHYPLLAWVRFDS
jgi:endonuclease/exonuclease/phosphatase family metal-dependent hydrolase